MDTALDRQFEGTGLGLSMVKGLIDLHDDKITIIITSVPDQGSTAAVNFHLSRPSLNSNGRSPKGHEIRRS